MPVMLHVVDDSGEPIALLGATIAGADGSYSMTVLNVDDSDPGLLLEVPLDGDTSLWAFSGGAAQDIDIVTTGVSMVINMIVKTRGGAGASDYAPAEVAQLYVDGRAALTAAGTDLADHEAVVAELIDGIGGAIADASGSEVQTVDVSDNPIAVAPADARVDVTDLYEGVDDEDVPSFLDATGQRWDWASDGTVMDGTDDSYDDWGFVSLDEDFDVDDDDEAELSGGADRSIHTEDTREVVFGPYETTSELVMVRKNFASETSGFARMLVIVENTGPEAETFTFSLAGNLGTDEDYDHASYTSSGDAEVDAGDVWIVNADPDDRYESIPSWFAPGGVFSKADDEVGITWSDVELAAGAKVIFAVWMAQSMEQDMGEALADWWGSVVRGLPPAFFEGMTVAEFDMLHTKSLWANVFGPSGSVAPGATVTATNTTARGDAVVIEANRDGSFGLNVQGGSGDSISVTATDGTDETVTLP